MFTLLYREPNKNQNHVGRRMQKIAHNRVPHTSIKNQTNVPNRPGKKVLLAKKFKYSKFPKRCICHLTKSRVYCRRIYTQTLSLAQNCYRSLSNSSPPPSVYTPIARFFPFIFRPFPGPRAGRESSARKKSELKGTGGNSSSSIRRLRSATRSGYFRPRW